MRGQPRHDTRSHAQFPPRFLDMDTWMISKLNVDLFRKWVNDVLRLFLFDMPSMGVCTTRHWQTSGRLVQELNVYTEGQEAVLILTGGYLWDISNGIRPNESALPGLTQCVSEVSFAASINLMRCRNIARNESLHKTYWIITALWYTYYGKNRLCSEQKCT